MKSLIAPAISGSKAINFATRLSSIVSLALRSISLHSPFSTVALQSLKHVAREALIFQVCPVIKSCQYVSYVKYYSINHIQTSQTYFICSTVRWPVCRSETPIPGTVPWSQSFQQITCHALRTPRLDRTSVSGLLSAALKRYLYNLTVHPTGINEPAPIGF